MCNTPVAGSILMLVRHGRLTKEEGIKYLNSLKDMIKDEHLFYVKSSMCFTFTMCAAMNRVVAVVVCGDSIVRFTDCVRAGFA